jgi:hypothetical protein
MRELVIKKIKQNIDEYKLRFAWANVKYPDFDKISDEELLFIYKSSSSLSAIG